MYKGTFISSEIRDSQEDPHIWESVALKSLKTPGLDYRFDYELNALMLNALAHPSMLSIFVFVLCFTFLKAFVDMNGTAVSSLKSISLSLQNLLCMNTILPCIRFLKKV